MISFSQFRAESDNGDRVLRLLPCHGEWVKLIRQTEPLN